MTAFGTRWVEQLLERYNASGPDALANGRRHNGLKPSLDSGGLEVVRLRLAEPPPDGGLWSSRKVAEVGSISGWSASCPSAAGRR